MKNFALVGLISIFLVFFIVVSCKKKKEANSETPTVQSNPYPNTVNGFFQSSRQFTFFNDTLKLQSGSSEAILYDSLVATGIFDPTKGIDVGSIRISTVTLQKGININVYPNAYFFYDSLNNIVNKPCTWSISGKNSFLPLTINDEASFPSYSGYYDLPDTLFVGKSNTILISNYYGADRVEIILRGESRSVTKILTTPAKQITFDMDEMSEIDVLYGEPLEIFLIFIKTDFKYFGSKIYQFNTETTLLKHCEFKKAHP